MGEIALSEEVYEGQLFGWRWFIAAEGPNVLVAPTMSTAKKTYTEEEQQALVFQSPSQWVDTFHKHFNTYDLFDWNEADGEPSMEVANGSGFWFFQDYSDCIKRYAETTLKRCRRGPLEIPYEGLFYPEGWPTSTGPYQKKILSFPIVPVLGFVEGSGIVVEHEIGYRAQKLRIVKLFSLGWQRQRAELAERLGWPDEIKRVRKLGSYPNPATSNLRRLGL